MVDGLQVKIKALHNDWFLDLLIDESTHAVELGEIGSKGHFERDGMRLIVHWDNFPKDVFIRFGDLYIHDLLTVNRDNASIGTTTVALNPVVSKAAALIEARRFDDASTIIGILRSQYPNQYYSLLLEADLYARRDDLIRALDVIQRCSILKSEPHINESIIHRGVRLKIFLTGVGRTPHFLAPANSSPMELAAIVMMLRDEEDIIIENLNHHYMIGFRKFVLILNLCADQTERLICEFAGEHKDACVIIITDPRLAYFQAGKTQAALEFARAYFRAVNEPISWVFVLDADEFICCDDNLGIGVLLAAATEAESDVIAFNLCNTTNSRFVEYRPHDDIYRHFDTIVPCGIPVVTKYAYALRIDPKIRPGNHTIWYEGIGLNKILVALEYGFRIIHLPYRSKNHTRTKIINGGTSLSETSIDINIGGHWRANYAEYINKGDVFVAELYERHCRNTVFEATHEASFRFE